MGGGGSLCVIGVPPDSTLIRCRNSAPKMDIELFDNLSGLMDCFDLLCDEGEGDISSICNSPGVFPQNWLQQRLSNTGLLEVTGVCFDVFEIGLIRAANVVCFGAESVVSDVTEDGEEIPMTLAARSRGGGSGCSVWLKLVSREVEPVAPPIRAGLRTVVFFQNGGMVPNWIVYTRRESVGVLRVTGSLLHLVLACRLAVLCDCLSCDYLHVPRFCVDS